MSDAKRVRVVAVDDEPVTLAIITQALAGHPTIELVGTGVNGREALQLANRLHPDVVVLDIEMPIINGIEAAARIRAVLPSIGVLMLTALTDSEVVKAALRAGALNYLSKGSEISNIGAAVMDASRRRDVQAPQRGLASMWTFYGTKGCSGASTLGVNTAIQLAQLSFRVLLLDLDMMQGDCAFILGLTPRPPQEQLLARISEAGGIDEEMVAKAVRPVPIPGHEGPPLHVLDTPCTFLPLEGEAEANLSLMLEFVMTAYDFVVVDLPPGRLLDRALAPLMDYSERLFLMSNRDLCSLKSLVSLGRVLGGFNFDMSKVSVVFAGMLEEAGFDHMAFTRAQNLGIRRMIEMPLDRETVARAVSLGMPSQLIAPDAPLPVFTRLLVEEALNLPPTHERKGTFWESVVKGVRGLLGSVAGPRPEPA